MKMEHRKHERNNRTEKTTTTRAQEKEEDNDEKVKEKNNHNKHTSVCLARTHDCVHLDMYTAMTECTVCECR